MLCEECKIEMLVERATNERPYRFERCGLDHVYLIGIEKHVCPRCRAVYPVVPKIQELHKVIASALVNKSAELTGPEIRYLRQWIGMQSQDFAQLLGFGPAHLSKVENGHAQLGAAGDRLVKLYAWSNINHIAFEEVSERFRRLKRLRASKGRILRRRFQIGSTIEGDQVWKQQKERNVA